MTLAVVATVGTRALAETNDSLDSLMLGSSEDAGGQRTETQPPSAGAALNITGDGGDEHVGTAAADRESALDAPPELTGQSVNSKDPNAREDAFELNASRAQEPGLPSLLAGEQDQDSGDRIAKATLGPGLGGEPPQAGPREPTGPRPQEGTGEPAGAGPQPLDAQSLDDLRQFTDVLVSILEGRGDSPTSGWYPYTEANLRAALAQLEQWRARLEGQPEAAEVAELVRRGRAALRDDPAPDPGQQQMTAVDQPAPQLPGYSQEDTQVPKLPGTVATKVPELPGTRATQQAPDLPGFTSSEQDSSLLHAQATPAQNVTKMPTDTRIRALVDAELPRITAAARFALGSTLATAIWSSTGIVARDALSRLALKP